MEIEELEKIEDELDSYTVLALHLNASFEKMRREGHNYESTKKELIAIGKEMKRQREEFEKFQLNKLRKDVEMAK